jgi:sodium/potassium-transporting ATPase subunit alpha
MDPQAEKKVVATEDTVEMVQTTTHLGGDQRIQFIPTVKPEREPRAGARDDGSAFVPPSRRSQSVGSLTQRRQSGVSLPPVISEKQKARREQEKEEEKKHVDINEHLMPHLEVAEKYHTRINMAKPGDSLGLTSEQAAQLLTEYGPNILTPPSKRHWILKFWDCLKSLFNLLLIFAGILEYILLGINFHENFQNVSLTSMSSSGNARYTHLYLSFPDLPGCHSNCRCLHQCLH